MRRSRWASLGQVTTFTLSDFGRTLQPASGGGTDHAWGSHHFIIGDAVQGGDIYGHYPQLVLGGPDDAEKEGRWLPTTVGRPVRRDAGPLVRRRHDRPRTASFPIWPAFRPPTWASWADAVRGPARGAGLTLLPGCRYARRVPRFRFQWRRSHCSSRRRRIASGRVNPPRRLSIPFPPRATLVTATCALARVIMITVGVVMASRCAPAAADVAVEAYRVEIVAPAPVKAAVERSLDLVRWQSYAEITPEFFDLLVADARSQARDAAAAQGYFSAVVDQRHRPIDQHRRPCACGSSRASRRRWRRSTWSSPARRRSAVPTGASSIARMRREWSLPKGAVFRQADWAAGKTGAVRVFTVEPLRGGQIGRAAAPMSIRKRIPPR